MKKRNQEFPSVFPFCCIFTVKFSHCGVRDREVERRPRNLEVPSSIPGSGCQLWDFSLAHTFGESTGVVPRKQNRERLVDVVENLFLNRCKINISKLLRFPFLC